MTENQTPLPVDMAAFWSSNANKTKIQCLLRKWVSCKAPTECPNVQIILSGMSGEEPSHCVCVEKGRVKELDLNLEEADTRLILHVDHAARNGARRIVLCSADTDVFVLALHFCTDFEK